VSYRSKAHLVGRLLKKAYRDAYTEQRVKTALPQQIRTIRLNRNLTQSDLAKLAHTTQTVIARVEDINYGNLSLNTLLKIAQAYDVGLLVKFVPYSRLVQEFEDRSNDALDVPEFQQDIQRINAWAASGVGPSISLQLKQQLSGSDQPRQTGAGAYGGAQSQPSSVLVAGAKR